MRGVQQLLFGLVAISITLGLGLLAAVLFPRYPSLAFFGVFIVGMAVLVKLRLKFDERALERRIAPVLAVLKKVGPMASKERDYQRALVEQFFTDLSPSLKPESPLSSGTRVDAWLSFDGDEWYVTVKRKKLDNQVRLCLQGEIEDILLHAPKRGKDLWVVVILGLSNDTEPVVLGQINSLIDYAANRSVEASRGPKSRDVHIKVVPVSLAA